MAEIQRLQKIPMVFYRTSEGTEPVRLWLKKMAKEDRKTIGADLQRAQWRWPAGMPLCRPLGQGLWEIRTELTGNRISRVLVSLYREHLVALHAIIKKTQKTPPEALALARKRKKEIER